MMPLLLTVIVGVETPPHWYNPPLFGPFHDNRGGLYPDYYGIHAPFVFNIVMLSASF
jgi:hypothetical protein